VIVSLRLIFGTPSRTRFSVTEILSETEIETGMTKETLSVRDIDSETDASRGKNSSVFSVTVSVSETAIKAVSRTAIIANKYS
jgi:CCR4-NOT transcriptional regulation complex NOT5 subunit